MNDIVLFLFDVARVDILLFSHLFLFISRGEIAVRYQKDLDYLQ